MRGAGQHQSERLQYQKDQDVVRSWCVTRTGLGLAFPQPAV